MMELSAVATVVLTDPIKVFLEVGINGNLTVALTAEGKVELMAILSVVVTVVMAVSLPVIEAAVVTLELIEIAVTVGLGLRIILWMSVKIPVELIVAAAVKLTVGLMLTSIFVVAVELRAVATTEMGTVLTFEWIVGVTVVVNIDLEALVAVAPKVEVLFWWTMELIWFVLVLSSLSLLDLVPNIKPIPRAITTTKTKKIITGAGKFLSLKNKCNTFSKKIGSIQPDFSK